MLLLVAVGLIGLPVLGAILWIDKHNIEHERETRTEIDNLIELVAEKHDYELTFYTVFAGQLLFSLAAVGLLVLLAIRMTRSRTLAAANRQLEDARTLMQATLDAAPVAITIRDENLRFVFANEAALEKFKLTRGQIFGRTTREALGDWQDPDYIEYLDRVDREVLRSGEPLPFDT
ncbi:MAG: PAS domain-containing protein, partial [Alphaproteobacteria bacterium]